jgi:hypothetical protein
VLAVAPHARASALFDFIDHLDLVWIHVRTGAAPAAELRANHVAHIHDVQAHFEYPVVSPASAPPPGSAGCNSG